MDNKFVICSSVSDKPCQLTGWVECVRRWWAGMQCTQTTTATQHEVSYTTDIPCMSPQQHSLDIKLNWHSSLQLMNNFIWVCGGDTQQKPLVTTEEAQMPFTSSQTNASQQQPHSELLQTENHIFYSELYVNYSSALNVNSWNSIHVTTCVAGMFISQPGHAS